MLRNYDISSLDTLFLAGERCDPDTLHWAEKQLEVPVIDHWWQTESGWPMAANPMGIEALEVKAGSPTVAVPGYDIQVLDEAGNEVPRGESGNIMVKLPLPPGTLPTFWGNRQRYFDACLSQFEGYYLTGDAGIMDEQGYLWVMSRIDDVINVAGHRLSTGVLEEALATNRDVAECAVIGVEDKLKGEMPLGFVVLNSGADVDETELRKELDSDSAFAGGTHRHAQGYPGCGPPSENPLRQDSQRHHAEDCRLQGIQCAGDDRRSGGPG